LGTWGAEIEVPHDCHEIIITIPITVTWGFCGCYSQTHSYTMIICNDAPLEKIYLKATSHYKFSNPDDTQINFDIKGENYRNSGKLEIDGQNDWFHTGHGLTIEANMIL
jgi:hypothetical protein